MIIRCLPAIIKKDVQMASHTIEYTNPQFFLGELKRPFLRCREYQLTTRQSDLLRGLCYRHGR